MPKPFDELREQLLRAGVAPRHVRRYLTELTDHLADLRREEMHSARNAGDAEVEAFARLGNMDDLAKAMIEQRQFQSWCARAPWAMFVWRPRWLWQQRGRLPCSFCGPAGISSCQEPTRLSAATGKVGSRIFIFNSARRSTSSRQYLSAGESERLRPINDCGRSGPPSASC